jgi:hypothetical protein
MGMPKTFRERRAINLDYGKWLKRNAPAVKRHDYRAILIHAFYEYAQLRRAENRKAVVDIYRMPDAS